MKKVLFVFGTRPEAIKLAPIINNMKPNPFLKPIVCVTGQHRKMLDQVLQIFTISPDYDLNLMKKNQTLFDITIRILGSLKNLIMQLKPDIVVVQGDTTSSFIAALASFYLKTPIAHVEAGLRSFNKYSPFPEEINRKLTTQIADLHFAPTKAAYNNLIKEGVNKNIIHITGNTVIDSFNYIFNKYNFKKNKQKKKQILVTGHRRENFGEKFKQMCHALKEIASKFEDIDILYPVHLNPNVKKPVHEILSNIKNIKLIPPVDYIKFLEIMCSSYLILTDSGGVQEEAPSLKIPVLIMRDTTERPEGVEAGIAKLVGTNKKTIVKEVTMLLKDENYYKNMTIDKNPYGDGNSSLKIIKLFEKFLIKH